MQEATLLRWVLKRNKKGYSLAGLITGHEKMQEYHFCETSDIQSMQKQNGEFLCETKHTLFHLPLGEMLCENGGYGFFDIEWVKKKKELSMEDIVYCIQHEVLSDVGYVQKLLAGMPKETDPFKAEVLEALKSRLQEKREQACLEEESMYLVCNEGAEVCYAWIQTKGQSFYVEAAKEHISFFQKMLTISWGEEYISFVRRETKDKVLLELHRENNTLTGIHVCNLCEQGFFVRTKNDTQLCDKQHDIWIKGDLR